MKLPVYVYRHVKLLSLNGEVHISTNVIRGMIRLGHYSVGTLDVIGERTIWQNNGLVVFKGSAYIGSGSRLSINKGAELIFGNDFCLTGRSSLICQEKILFGESCLLSWDILMMDTDFHQIRDNQNIIRNNPRPIIVGNNVWIGCRNIVLKGVEIADNVVVAAGSKITKDICESNVIVGGVDAIKILKRNITWCK